MKRHSWYTHHLFPVQLSEDTQTYPYKNSQGSVFFYDLCVCYVVYIRVPAAYKIPMEHLSPSFICQDSSRFSLSLSLSLLLLRKNLSEDPHFIALVEQKNPGQLSLSFSPRNEGASRICLSHRENVFFNPHSFWLGTGTTWNCFYVLYRPNIVLTRKRERERERTKEKDVLCRKTNSPLLTDFY